MDLAHRLIVMLAGVCLLLAVATVAGGPSAARAQTSPDYRRALQTVADLRAFPPDVPLVVMLGGSSARSSTVSDLSWTRQIRAKTGFRLVAFNLGSKERLISQDRRLVGMLPDVHPLVYLGVNMGRFCRGHVDPRVVLPEPSGKAPALRSRSTVTLRALPTSRKRQMVAEWMQKRWSAFLRNYKYQLRVLESTVRISLRRGQHPVIIDLPRNMQIIGHQLDQPLKRYHAGCRAIARRNGVPYVQFQSRAGLRNSDFRDLWHLLPQSRIKWQRQLAATTATLLKRYHMSPSPVPSPSPSPDPSPSASPAPGS